MDEEVSRLLHRSDKPVLLVINKVDNALRVPDTVEFFALGIDKTFHISAVNGSGTGELLDAVIHALPEGKEPENIDLPRFAVVGRPQCGKIVFYQCAIGYRAKYRYGSSRYDKR